jgi:phage tail-like protein
MPITGVPGTFVASHFQLKLDGLDAGLLKSVDGGATSAEVINEAVGPSNFVKKHIGPPRYEAFTIQIGLWMGSVVYEWLQAAWKMNYVRKNGSVVAYDSSLEARSEREFFNALITEVTIPAMDASSKDQCYMTVKFAPEMVRTKKASGKVTLPPVTAAKEMWLASNFRLEIAGLDCSKVSAIGSFSVRHAAVTDAIGDARIPLKEPGRVEFPNLSITLPQSAAATWMDWFDDFVVKGHNGDEREKSGSLIFLSPNLQAELGRVNFFNVGIFKIASAKADAADERIQRVTADLYCERMELQLGKLGNV